MENYDLTIKKLKNKFTTKRFLLTILLVFSSFLLYTIIGGIIPFLSSNEVNQNYKNSFNINRFYSDDISNERALILEDNIEAFKLMINLIESAKEQILISTYKYSNDFSGLSVLAALYEAAKRGVKVDFILDGLTVFSNPKKTKELMALNTLENVEVKVYNKINALTPWTHNGRLHSKYIIIDKNIYIVGGRNIGNSSLSNDIKTKKIDRDILVYNENTEDYSTSIYQLLNYNNELWNYKYLTPLSNKKLFKGYEKYLLILEDYYQTLQQEFPSYFNEINYKDITMPVNKINILTNPIHVYNKEPLVFYSLVELMNNANSSIKIHTPYIIMDKSMYESLTNISQKHIKTTIFTNSVANNENPFGANELRIAKNKILNTNFDLYEFEGGYSYHGKTISIDNRLSIIGSFNMDMRSAYIDTEIMVVIDSAILNEQLNVYLESYESQSVLYTKEGKKVPEDVKPQKLSVFQKIRLNIIFILSHWLRFLM